MWNHYKIKCSVLNKHCEVHLSVDNTTEKHGNKLCCQLKLSIYKHALAKHTKSITVLLFFCKIQLNAAHTIRVSAGRTTT